MIGLLDLAGIRLSIIFVSFVKIVLSKDLFLWGILFNIGALILVFFKIYDEIVATKTYIHGLWQRACKIDKWVMATNGYGPV